jgi:hypothetical protein
MIPIRPGRALPGGLGVVFLSYQPEKTPEREKDSKQVITYPTRLPGKLTIAGEYHYHRNAQKQNA